MPFFSRNAILLSCFITPLLFVSFAAMNLTFFSFAAVNWTEKRRAFIVETFVKTSESVTAKQRAFCLHFNLGRHNPVQHETWSCYGLPTSELLNLH